MDKDILKTLSEFLPQEVIDEIAIINGFKNGNNNSNTIQNQNIKVNNEIKEDEKQEEIKEDEKQEEIKEDEKQEEIKEDGKQAEIKEDGKQEETQEDEENHNNIFDFIQNKKSEFKTKISLDGGNITYGFNNFNTIDYLQKLNLSYFVSPLSLTKIEYLLDFYKEVKDVFHGKDKSKFLPFSLDKGDNSNILGEYDEVRKLFNLVYILLNGVGKELIFENYEYNNSKLGKIDKSLFKNPEFYKTFLQKEKSNIKVANITLNTRKNAFLKYYLQKLEKSLLDSRSKSLINFINNVLLKDVKAKNYNINISNHKLLQKIFALILSIINGNIGLFKALIENANDTYEVWLLKELLLYGNLGNYYEGYNIKEEFNNIVNDKVYRIYDFSLYAKFYNKKEGLQKLINGDFNKNLLKTGKYITKKGLFYYSNMDLDRNKKNDILKIFIEGTFLDNNGRLNLKSTILEKLNKNKSNVEKINKIKTFKPSYSLGFLKEDNIICAENETSTFPLRKLTRGNYKVEISFGGNTNMFDSTDCKGSNLLCNNVSDIIKEYGETHEGILKNINQHKSGLTPDYIVKIKDGEKVIGNIIIDAKFSKFGYIYNGKVDYNPWMGYLEELKKYFSYNKSIYKNGNLPTKVIILYPGDQTFSNSDFGKQINDYFERVNGIVALPLTLGENKIDNLKIIFEYIEKYIKEF